MITYKNKGSFVVSDNRSIYAKGCPVDITLSQREKKLGVRYIVATFGNLKQQPMAPKYYGRQAKPKRYGKRIK